MFLGFQQTPTVWQGSTTSNIGAATVLFGDDSLVEGNLAIPHGFDTQNVIVQVYDNNRKMVLPSEISIEDNNNVVISLACGTPIEGTWRATVLADKGGQNVLGSYAVDFVNDNLVDNFLTVNHTLQSEYVVVQVYDNENKLVLPSEIEVVGPNTIRVSLECGTPIQGSWHLTIIATEEGLGIATQDTIVNSPDWVLIQEIANYAEDDSSIFTIPWDSVVYNSIKVEVTSFSTNSDIYLSFNSDTDPLSYQEIGSGSLERINLDGVGVTDTVLTGSLVVHGSARLLVLYKADQEGTVSTSINWLNSVDPVTLIGVETNKARYILQIYGK